MTGKKAPQYLSAPFQILWWDVDVWGIVLFFAFLAFTLGHIFFALAVIVPYAYSKAKKKYSRGFLKHVFYFAGFSDFQGYPSFFEEKFLE